jgi:hypothetical protein
MTDARYLATLLTALALACLLALSLWPDAGCRACGADVLRDAILLRRGR